MVTIGIIGFGYWGPNLVRNFTRLPQARVGWICDLDTKLLLAASRLYPGTKTTTNYREILSDDRVTAVVIATPPSTHFSLGKAALAAGKHVLIEKPLTIAASDAKQLIALARRKKKILMVDHTYVYTPAVATIGQILKKGELGSLLSIDSVRTNLGIIQNDVNILYDLACHDFSIIDYLLGTTPTSISAIGTNHRMLRQDTSAYITAQYPLPAGRQGKNVFVHVHVSWLTPVKIRRMMIIGTKKMLVYDDNESSEKLKIYDRGISISAEAPNTYQQRIGYRTGNIVSPFIPMAEGLVAMTSAFVEAIISGTPPPTSGECGFRVVKILESATLALHSKKKMIYL